MALDHDFPTFPVQWWALLILQYSVDGMSLVVELSYLLKAFLEPNISYSYIYNSVCGMEGGGNLVVQHKLKVVVLP